MSLLQFFRPKKKDTANLAKERLQIIVAERRNHGSTNPSYLPQLKEDILQVLSKYVSVDPSMVNVSLEQGDDDLSVLELNIQLPEKE
ncbi:MULTISPECIES: cell division topological specificity factor MinE [Vibrio]|uniref:Cell division topological specificity factor n=1 Tax=Vibrio casei TaxID=673372 RepID=A0A368LLV2_9VIBR|nr:MULTISPECIES: cell division topological specificity factor MinE [Vibrio]RCS72890.1 cell division topological specificity factor MinE [Vibrio casei]SJN38614.1 Cell division topological specificity factor MinE [Vibrio casei]HBV75275.1 cell division topological specificity factor MinE [Vibrio sp.]